MNEENERAVPARPPSALTGECKEARPRDESYIDRAPDKQVVLSQRLEYLARQVGGCQTEEVLALVRRIMYEVIAKQKY